MDERQIGRLEHGALRVGLAAHSGAAPSVDAAAIAGNIVGKRGIEEKRGEAGEPEMQLVELVVEGGVGFLLLGELGDGRKRQGGGIGERKMIGGHGVELFTKLGDYGFLGVGILEKRGLRCFAERGWRNRAGFREWRQFEVGFSFAGFLGPILRVPPIF